MAAFVRRVIHDAEGGVRGERATDESFSNEYPALWEYLSLDWLEGSERLTSTLGLSIDCGQWKARLADRDNGMVCFVSGASYEDTLRALEAALAAGEADWRRDQFAKPRKQAKRP